MAFLKKDQPAKPLTKGQCLEEVCRILGNFGYCKVEGNRRVVGTFREHFIEMASGDSWEEALEELRSRPPVESNI